MDGLGQHGYKKPILSPLQMARELFVSMVLQDLSRSHLEKVDSMQVDWVGCASIHAFGMQRMIRTYR